jgi:predicted nucleic acid-binding protein
MSARPPEVLCDTDVLVEYLVDGGAAEPALLTLARTAMCFTSVWNATELLAGASGDGERQSIESMLGGIHILGFHHRYCRDFADAYRGGGSRGPLRDAVIAGLSIAARLPIVTYRMDRYAAFPGTAVLDARAVAGASSWPALAARIHEQSA